MANEEAEKLTFGSFSMSFYFTPASRNSKHCPILKNYLIYDVEGYAIFLSTHTSLDYATILKMYSKSIEEIHNLSSVMDALFLPERDPRFIF